MNRERFMPLGEAAADAMFRSAMKNACDEAEVEAIRKSFETAKAGQGGNVSVQIAWTHKSEQPFRIRFTSREGDMPRGVIVEYASGFRFEGTNARGYAFLGYADDGIRNTYVLVCVPDNGTLHYLETVGVLEEDSNLRDAVEVFCQEYGVFYAGTPISDTSKVVFDVDIPHEEDG